MGVTSFNVESTAEQVTNALADHIAGKNVLINGASPGSLGAEAARWIATRANLVILGGRSLENLHKTIDIIKQDVPSANLRPFIFDMSSLAGARKAAEQVNAMSEPIHVLINSAGIMAAPWSKTVDGFEHHMGVNHFAPFLFTSLVSPKLKATGTSSDPARIVNITSKGHFFACLQEDINFWDGEWYQKYCGYGQSKTANILFANEIARRAKESGAHIVAYSVHPGAIGTTNLGVYIGPEDLAQLRWEDGTPKWPFKSAEQGAAGYVVAAFDPSLLPHSGAYIADSDVSEERAKHAQSQADGERLWELSEKLTGQKFELSRVLE